MATLRLIGTCRQRIGWRRKTDAAAHVRHLAGGGVVRVDFGRLYGCQWVAIAGVGSDVEIVTHDGARIAARREWPTLTITAE